MKHEIALHIFRRDLRLQDNTALQHALAHAQIVIPCFIFDPRQVTKNSYKSENAVQFMINSLQELDQELKKKKSKLYMFYSKPEKVITSLITKLNITLLTCNKDYTPFSLRRDETIKNLCKKKNIEYVSFEDALLHAPEKTLKKDKKPYTVFTPYKRNAQKIKVPQPLSNKRSNYYTKSISSTINQAQFKKISPQKNKKIKIIGGRKEGLKLIKKATTLKNYSELRNIPHKDYTSHLSAHHKFGTVSIRETYHAIKQAKIKDLLNELYWRDFFTTITYHFPRVLGKAFKEKYNKIPWSKSKTRFDAWCTGTTGFPIIDAGMRELNTTGFMHNRVRMITASFLVKDLHLDWRWGEKYFAQKLVDYDPAVNNGNWQWAASTGCDAQPYFRIFNPWLQQKKFDPECLYIKKWIPELKNIEAKEVHNLYKKPLEKNDYPKPIIDHKQQANKAIALFK